EVCPQQAGLVVKTKAQSIQCRTVILATGGLSYPQTGSTGHGLKIAASLGHALIPPRPGLVPLLTAQGWPGQLAGVSLDHVVLRAMAPSGRYSSAGPLVFTNDGIGGPATMDLSRDLAAELAKPRTQIPATIDLSGNLNQDVLEQLVLGWARTSGSSQVLTCLSGLLPKRLARVVLDEAGCDSKTLACELDKANRARIVQELKAMPITITGTKPLEQATITIGGVDTRQVDPRTMASRVCPGLFFAGEILDVDGPCGGYNLQICWSTGALAGRSAALMAAHRGA
ncbi:MAG: aminoacetone oxidase family FAD-binding enzyme, partial [Sedimentisphaerales bacterium]|nr:aminoacetone oxidase family FAD-binding enzyme [Sedimentisphaerales bacterium]